MRITHTLKIGRMGREQVSVALTEHDLLPAERAEALQPYWAMFLAIKAERQAIITKHAAVEGTRRETKARAKLKKRASELDALYNRLMGH